MKPLRIAGLLLASAALPLTPAFAQEAQTPTPAPAEAPQPTVEPPETAPVEQSTPTVSPPATRSEPVTNTRSSGREPASPDDANETAADAPAARPAPRQRAARAAAPSAARAPARPRAVAEPRAERAAAPVAEPAPEPAAVAPAPAPAPLAEAPPAPVAEAPPAAADPAPAAADAGAPAENRQGNSIWPWLLAAALGAGALFLFARRRRRRAEEEHYVYDEPVAYEEQAVAPVAAAHHEPVVHHQPVVHHEPVAQVYEEPVRITPADEAHVAPVTAAIPAAAGAAASNGRPWLDLLIRPVRAGVGEDAARVEFELGVENNGSAPAHDVRISTWLLPAGSGSEMERMLIEGGPAPQQRTEADLAPGEATRIDTEVALPRQGLVDAILPVVFADARYRLPDGSEGRTAASFAVGVPRGEELVMFDVDNPSGMHEGVEARLHGEPRRD
jgi:hypothetical protein